MGIKAFFTARSVALIGASDNNSFSKALFQNLAGFEAPAQLFLVNPKRTEVFGRPCWPSVKQIPESIDLAILAVSRRVVPTVLKDCIAKGVSSAVIVASGFAERDEAGRLLQEEISRLAKENRVEILGPNTMGFVALREKLIAWSSSLPKMLKSGNVSAIFHSSGMLNLFFHQCAERRVGLRYGVAPGNESTISLVDCLAEVVEDERTKVIALVLEHLGDRRIFGELLDRARELGKPVVILRLGKSVKAMKAVEAHTGRLGTPSRAWAAFVRQKGAIAVNTLDDLIETCLMFSQIGVKGLITEDTKEGGLGLVTISGGDCSLLVDICEEIGIELCEPSEEARKKISQKLGKDLFLVNPLDVEDLWSSNPEAFKKCLQYFAQDGEFQIVACRLNLPKAPNPNLIALYTGAAEAIRSAGKVPVFLARANEQLSEEWFDFFAHLSVPFLLEYRKGLGTIKAYLSFIKDHFRERQPLVCPIVRQPTKGKKEIWEKNTGSLPFPRLKVLLQEYGIPFASDGVASSADEALQLASAVGYPVAVKILSPDVPHRTEAGLVELNLRSSEELEAAYRRVLHRVEEMKPPIRIDGVLVQSMVLGGVEMVTGIFQDQLLGPAVLVGLGGIFVEVLNDVAVRVPPISHPEADEMIRGLKGSPLLMGIRGRPTFDVHALADIIVRLGWLARDFENEIESLDINPIIVYPEDKGIVAVDALMLRKE